MAQVALTNEQKELLKNSQRFKDLVEWAIINKAQYWIGLDGTSVPGNDWVKWAKSRYFASNTIIAAITSLDNNYEYYNLALMFLTHTVYDNSVSFDVDTVIDYMTINNTFDALADLIFDQKIKQQIF